MAFGLTPQGFVPMTLSDIRAAIREDFKAEYGVDVGNLEPDSVVGRFIDKLAERFAELWELVDAVHQSQYPAGAVGTSLDGVCAITGVSRLQPTKTLVTATLIGAHGTVVAAGKAASQSNGVQKRFTIPGSDVYTIETVEDWLGDQPYTLGARCKNLGHIYQCITAGTSAVSGGPTGAGAPITDGTAIWKWVAQGEACVDVPMECDDYGAFPCYSRSLDTIATAVSGWTGVTNLEDHESIGSLTELDSALRLRREASIFLPGAGTLGSVLADVLNTKGVTAAVIFENDTSQFNYAAMPPNSFEAVVYGGADNDIAQAIAQSKPAGIAAYGNASGTALDGSTQKFSRPTEADVYVAVAVEVSAAQFPTTGSADVVKAIAEYGDAHYSLGDGPHVSQLYAAVFSVPGVRRITSMGIGWSASPTGSQVTVTPRQMAKFDTARISVAVTFIP